MNRTVTLYLSHGASGDWFIVEPRSDPERLERQIESLRRVGREVIEVEATYPESYWDHWVSAGYIESGLVSPDPKRFPSSY